MKQNSNSSSRKAVKDTPAAQSTEESFLTFKNGRPFMTIAAHESNAERIVSAAVGRNAGAVIHYPLAEEIQIQF